MRFETDVVVAGAGPVGCVAALAFARRGARVTIVDPAPGTASRFAGELLHPRAVACLRALGVDAIPPADDHPRVRGFAVFSQHRRAPILLDYAGEHGATFAFDAFLRYLREIVASHPLITLHLGARVRDVDGQTVTWTRRGDRDPQTTVVPMVVNAVGRNGNVGEADRQTPERLSAMAGLLLRGVDLPYEGYGHVVLSRVGPALIYRVSADEVRVCLDVPFPWRKAGGRGTLVWNAYRDVLPEQIAPAVHAELEAGRIQWAVNALRPRSLYGRDGLVRVGDAVGHFHPMTAVGMTLGFGDALAVAEARDVASYARIRHKQTEVPGLLATALYEIFAVDSEPTAACREAVFRMWETKPRIRARTMGFLACEETRMSSLLGVGMHMVSRALREVAAQRRHQRQVEGAVDTGVRMAGLVHWLLADAVPEQMQIPPFKNAATPFAYLRQAQVERLVAELG